MTLRQQALRPIGRVLLVTLGLLLTLGALEIGLRVRAGTLFGLAPPRWAYHEVYGWANKRNFDARAQTDEFDVQGHQNQWGMLGPEAALDKRSGVFRIVIIGDSLTDGFQVRPQERFSERIASMANAGSNGPVEVINAGVAGYSTDQEVLYFEQELRQFRPDLVLVFFALSNDAMGNVREIRAPGEAVYKPLFGLADGRLTQPARVPDLNAAGTALNEIPIRPSDPLNALKRWLYFNFELYRTVSDAIYSVRAPRDRDLIEDWRVYGPQDEPRVVRAWAMTEQLLSRFKADVEADGARIGVVALPADFQVYPALWQRVLGTYHLPPSEWDPDGPDRRLAMICQRLSLACFDMIDDLRASGEGLYYSKDPHFTSKGHAVVGQAVFKWLRGSGLIR